MNVEEARRKLLEARLRYWYALVARERKYIAERLQTIDNYRIADLTYPINRVPGFVQGTYDKHHYHWTEHTSILAAHFKTLEKLSLNIQRLRSKLGYPDEDPLTCDQEKRLTGK